MTNPYNVKIFGLNAVVYASNKEEAIKYAQNVIKEHKRQFVHNEIMTLEEVVDALNISKQYLYRLKNEGKLIPFISNKLESNISNGTFSAIFCKDDDKPVISKNDVKKAIRDTLEEANYIA